MYSVQREKHISTFYHTSSLDDFHLICVTMEIKKNQLIKRQIFIYFYYIILSNPFEKCTYLYNYTAINCYISSNAVI